jgi:uncharacterized protein (TIGR03086 family)
MIGDDRRSDLEVRRTMNGQVSIDVPLLERTYAATADAIAAAQPTALDRPSPCDDWTVREVANHVVGGLDAFARTVEGRFDPAEARADVPDPDYIGDDPVTAYRAAAARCLVGFARPGVLDREYDFVFGPTPGRVIATISVQESLIHGWDIAQGAELAYEPDPSAVEVVAAFNAGFAEDDVRRRGMFAPPLSPPPDASDFEALLGRLGRRVE